MHTHSRHLLHISCIAGCSSYVPDQHFEVRIGVLHTRRVDTISLGFSMTRPCASISLPCSSTRKGAGLLTGWTLGGAATPREPTLLAGVEVLSPLAKSLLSCKIKSNY
jgi:hypothetical protein